MSDRNWVSAANPHPGTHSEQNSSSLWRRNEQPIEPFLRRWNRCSKGYLRPLGTTLGPPLDAMQPAGRNTTRWHRIEERIVMDTIERSYAPTL